MNSTQRSSAWHEMQVYVDWTLPRTSLNCAKISRQKSSFAQVPPCCCGAKFLGHLYACGARTIAEEANIKHIADFLFGQLGPLSPSWSFACLSVCLLPAAVLAICGTPEATNSSQGEARQRPLDSRRRSRPAHLISSITQQVRHSSSLSVQFEHQQPSSASVWKGKLSSRAR